jgi:hypothetical protein
MAQCHTNREESNIFQKMSFYQDEWKNGVIKKCVMIVEFGGLLSVGITNTPVSRCYGATTTSRPLKHFKNTILLKESYLQA